MRNRMRPNCRQQHCRNRANHRPSHVTKCGPWWCLDRSECSSLIHFGGAPSSPHHHRVAMSALTFLGFWRLTTLDFGGRFWLLSLASFDLYLLVSMGFEVANFLKLLAAVYGGVQGVSVKTCLAAAQRETTTVQMEITAAHDNRGWRIVDHCHCRQCTANFQSFLIAKHFWWECAKNYKQVLTLLWATLSPVAFTANNSLCVPLDDILGLLQDTEHLH